MQTPRFSDIVINVSEERFELMRDNNKLESDSYYRLTSHIYGVEFYEYGYSPDGVGVIWYDDPEFENASE